MQVGVQLKARRRRYSIDLNAHMAECEANYLRLMRLMPMLADRDRSAFAMPLGEQEPQVILKIVARHKYTTVIELSQENAPGRPGETPGDVPEDRAGDVPETRIGVRLYHDAKSAEVIAFQDQRRFQAVYEFPNRQMRHPDEKVQVNRFLGEFLRMCIAHGISIERPVPAEECFSEIVGDAESLDQKKLLALRQQRADQVDSTATSPPAAARWVRWNGG